MKKALLLRCRYAPPVLKISAAGRRAVGHRCQRRLRSFAGRSGTRRARPPRTSGGRCRSGGVWPCGCEASWRSGAARRPDAVQTSGTGGDRRCPAARPELRPCPYRAPSSISLRRALDRGAAALPCRAEARRLGPAAQAWGGSRHARSLRRWDRGTRSRDAACVRDTPRGSRRRSSVRRRRTGRQTPDRGVASRLRRSEHRACRQ